jgi:hypothetical protein
MIYVAPLEIILADEERPDTASRVVSEACSNLLTVDEVSDQID